MKKQIFRFVLLIIVAISASNCKKSDPAPPTVGYSSTSIALGEITSATKSAITMTKSGEGTITYTAASNVNWLKIDKTSGTIATSDIINLSTIVPDPSLVAGDNSATVTITPTINGTVFTPMVIAVKGTYKVTTLVPSATKIDFGTIKTTSTQELTLTKVGTEALTYDITADKAWLLIDKKSGTLATTDKIVFTADSKTLTSGAQTANITITPKSNGTAVTPIVIPVTVNYDDAITGTIEGHTLTKNETWGGNVNLVGDILVPVNFKLTILPGTKIKVKTLSSKDLGIEVNGELIMNGNEQQIIEVSSDGKSSSYDWDGFEVYGDVSASYAIVENALTAFDFLYSGFGTKPTKSPNFHHLLFINNYESIGYLKSNFATTMSNITFKSGFYFQFYSAGVPNLTIDKCEFLNPNALDFIVFASNQNIKFTNSNFVNKSNSKIYNCDVYFKSTDATHYSNVISTASNCYGLNSVGPGFGANANTFIQSNAATSANANIGCGFTSKYSSARVSKPKTLTNAELNALKAGIVAKIRSARK